MARTKQRDQEHFVFEQKARYGTGKAYKPFIPGPNPELSKFIEAHATPYDEKTDQYDVTAFDRDLVVDKAAAPKAIYDMHTYWSKKHWAAIREYIRHYLPKKNYPEGTGLVLDCFSGSGMTGVAAMMENRPCVLIDASPTAAFISHCYTHPVDPQELQEAYDQMMTTEYPKELKKKLKEITGKEIVNLQQELDWLYATKCDRCGGDATIEYVVYSEQYQCPQCGEIVALFDCPETKVAYQVGGKAKQKVEMKKRRVCPHCMKKYGEPHRDFVISTRTKRFGSIPVMVNYFCRGACHQGNEERFHNEPLRTKKAQYFTEYDLAKLKKIEASDIPHWYPRRKMMDVEDPSKPWGVKWRAGTSNFRTVDELYTRRNLWAMAALIAAGKNASSSDPFLLAIVGMALGVSRMNMYVPTNYSMQNRIMKGTYYTPQISTAVNIYPQYVNKLKTIRKAEGELCEHLVGPILVDQNTVLIADKYPVNSFDFIFTDPAYVDKIQYGELNFIWDAWLGFDGQWLRNEIVVNNVRNKTVEDWDHDMRIVFTRLYDALKSGRWMSLCYHDTDPATWTRLQKMLLDTGFEVHTVTVLDPIQKSMNQKSAEKVVKSDLVVNCRKPRPGEQKVNGSGGEVGQVSRRVRDILIETLANSGGQAKDKLWDIVLKRLLSRGQMAAHRFDDILAEIATRAESGRWFLKEEYESLSQSDINNEDAAGSAIERFARLRCAGTPVHFAVQIALSVPHLALDGVDEKKVEEYIRHSLIQDPAEAKKISLGGRMRGVEFYDCLFFYLTRFLKGRPAGQTPRRNLAEFLEEYLVRFKDGDKWLYRPPDQAEATGLKKARQTGLGRRIRQYVSFLRGEGEYPAEKMPGPKTLVAWLKHCSSFGLAEEGVLLFEKGGLAGRLMQLSEDDRYDAEDYYAQCSRKSAKKTASEDADIEDAEEDEG